MNRNEKRKNDKIKRRKKRVDKRNRAIALKQSDESNKINFSIDPFNLDIIPEKFVVDVRNCLQSIRLNDRELFSKRGEMIFKAIQNFGIENYMQGVEKVDANQMQSHIDYILFEMGGALFKKLQEKNILLNYIPFTHVNIVPNNDHFVLVFRALLRHKTKYGTVYYSSLKPTIKINNNDYIVGFTRHATQRICERAIFDWQTYSGTNNAFIYLDRYIKFDLVEDSGSYGRKYFITFYEKCSHESGTMIYLNEVLNKNVNDFNYCFRIGYCPIGLNDNFACAITLLTPGMKGTPEDYLIKNANLPFEKERKIRNDVQDMISKNIWLEKENFEAIKWFHQNGIPQVISVNEKIYQEFDWPEILD
jgi:hypothetical protein